MKPFDTFHSIKRLFFNQSLTPKGGTFWKKLKNEALFLNTSSAFPLWGLGG